MLLYVRWVCSVASSSLQPHEHGAFSKKEDWSGLTLPTAGDPPHRGIKPASLASTALAGQFFLTPASPIPL